MKAINKLQQVFFLLLSFCITSLLYAQSAGRVDSGGAYRVTKLVSDIPIPGVNNTDSDLINAWGIAFNPDGFVWVADNGSGKATLYDGDGKKNENLIVTIPGTDTATNSKPTGIVFFGGQSSFIVTEGQSSGPARFIFSTENGTLAAWAPNVGCDGPCPSKHAVQVATSTDGAIYKGLALAASGKAYQLYATDFHNGKIDVFNAKFELISLGENAFKDSNIPEGFAPFGIQNIGGVIYVTYAKQDDNKEDEVKGPGLGYVNAFSSDNGQLIQRIASGDKLNAPWGLALSPGDFGKFSNHLLVGNFGDGAIIAYDLNNLDKASEFLKEKEQPIKIDGLWGISFGNGLLNQPTNSLFFAAGPDDEMHGLYGKIEPDDKTQSNNDKSSGNMLDNGVPR